MNSDEQEFEDYLKQISDYAKKAGVSVSYVEMEFLIDGELIEVSTEN